MKTVAISRTVTALTAAVVGLCLVTASSAQTADDAGQSKKQEAATKQAREKPRAVKRPTKLRRDGDRVKPAAGEPQKRGVKAKRAGARPGARAKGHKPFDMNPNAKWACDNTVFTHGDVWRNNETLNFTFFIRNEGTEPLKIKARGG